MGLFEEAGIILKSDEKIVKRGRCKGKVPKGVKSTVSAWSGALKFKVDWEKVDGELVLTSKRLIVLGEEWGRIVLFPDLELENFVAVRTERVYPDKEELLLFMNLGTGKIEKMQLEVDGASEWVNAIRSLSSVLGEEKQVG